MSVSKPEAHQTAQLILTFDGFEDVKGTLAPDHSSVALIYATVASAEQAMRHQFKSSRDYWKSPSQSSSLSQTFAHRKEIVHTLLAVMKDPTQAIEKDRDIFKMRWASDSEDKYGDVVMEATYHWNLRYVQ